MIHVYGGVVSVREPRVESALSLKTVGGCLLMCIWREGVLTLADKVEHCFRPEPVPVLGRTLCDCVVCASSRVLGIEQIIRWLAKN